MRKGFGFHDRHSPFRFNPVTLFVGGAVNGLIYDVSDQSTLFQDSAGTLPVTAIGDPVGLILDKSGNGNHAFQSGSTSRPLWQQSGGYYYLQFDASNDSLLTNSINLSATNKTTIFAGITRSTNGGVRILAEFSADADSNNGTFQILAPHANDALAYRFLSKGTTDARAGWGPVSVAPAPDTAVLTCIGDIGGDNAVLRRNGVQVAQNTSDQGTGNYGNYPLYIGRRNNASLPFNGRLYGLIVLGAAASDWQVYVTEQWMAGKTGLQF